MNDMTPTPSDASQAVELPPLPSLPLRFAVRIADDGKRLDYSADDMQAYARAAIAQDRAARAQAEPVAHCSICGDTGVVLDEWLEGEGGVLYDEPINCVKDCPACPARARLAAPTIPQAAEVPGFVLVPIKPTTDMFSAAYDCTIDGGDCVVQLDAGEVLDVWGSMLAAASTPTASAPKAEGEAIPAQPADPYGY